VSALTAWIEELPAAVTVTAADGTILAMNARAREAYAAGGGDALIGTNVLDCHPEPSRTVAAGLYERQSANHYLVTQEGHTRVVHQVPWYRGGVFAGIVELVFSIPGPLPHHDRDA
jgi:transcriptional regulator with PAS, ATPase and Fis domain